MYIIIEFPFDENIVIVLYDVLTATMWQCVEMELMTVGYVLAFISLICLSAIF